MSIKLALIAYITTLIAYLILDGIWLGIIAQNTYTDAMDGLMRDDYPIAPWVVFYVIYCAVITYLVVLPNTDKGWLSVALAGAALGLASYGAYNLTNFAIIKDWPLGITLKDWAWGISVTTATSLAGFGAFHYFKQ